MARKVKLGKVSVADLAQNANTEQLAYAHGASMSTLGREAKGLNPESRRYQFIVGQSQAHKKEGQRLLNKSSEPMKAKPVGSFTTNRSLDMSSKPSNSRNN